MRTSLMSSVDALADAQLGVIARAQCLRLGISPGTIRWLLASRRWQLLEPGVYATHLGPLDWRSRVSAALLHCGEGAVASHHTAARLHTLLDQDPAGVEVLIPPTRRVISPARVHVATCVGFARRTAPSGWPTRTTVEDTVLDLADRGDSDNAIAWVSKACQRRRTTTARLADALDKRARRRWRELLVDALSDMADGVESVLEYRYVRRVETPHGLPTARRQKVVFSGGRARRTDNEYEPFGLVVELDGRLGHEGAGAFRDRQRDNITSISGKVTLRFGWADVDAQACEVAHDVAAVLWARGWRGELTRCGAGCRATSRTA